MGSENAAADTKLYQPDRSRMPILPNRKSTLLEITGSFADYWRWRVREFGVWCLDCGLKELDDQERVILRKSSIQDFGLSLTCWLAAFRRYQPLIEKYLLCGQHVVPTWCSRRFGRFSPLANIVVIYLRWSDFYQTNQKQFQSLWFKP